MGSTSKRSTSGTPSTGKWYPLKGFHTLPRAGRVWLYCPSYTFMPIRSIEASLVSLCLDATHWMLYDSKNGTPAPPHIKVDKQRGT